MSKTKRRNDHVYVSKAQYIEKKYLPEEVKYVRRHRTKEELHIAAKERFEKFGDYWANRTKLVILPYTKEEQAKDAVKEYDMLHRDHTNWDSKAGTYFKKACNEDLRLKNKRLCVKILKGEEYDHQSYPDVFMTNRFVWDYY